MFVQMPVHIEAVPQQVRLMAPSLPQTLKLRLVEVVLQNRNVVGVRALLDNNPGTLPGRQPAHISKALLSHNNVEVMLRLVNVGAHGHNARHARRVRL